MNSGTKDLLTNQLQMLTLIALSYELYGVDGYFELTKETKEQQKKVKEEEKKIGKRQVKINDATERLCILSQYLRIKSLKDEDRLILIKELNNIENELKEIIE